MILLHMADASEFLPELLESGNINCVVDHAVHVYIVRSTLFRPS